MCFGMSFECFHVQSATELTPFPSTFLRFFEVLYVAIWGPKIPHNGEGPSETKKKMQHPLSDYGLIQTQREMNLSFHMRGLKGSSI